MSKYFDGFIAERQSRGIPVTPELLQVNRRLKEKDEAKRHWENRGFWCKIGLHNNLVGLGGSYPRTCVNCWRHLL